METVNWRSILACGVVLGLVLASYSVGLALASPPVASPPVDHVGGLQPDTSAYAVQQGNRCFEVQPFGDGRTTVETFYSYRNPETRYADNSYTSYSSYGTGELQDNQVSSVFVYEGAGGVSLVFLHDERGVGSPAEAPYGGVATFELRGLPDGEWAVRDDHYGDGAQSDRWTTYGDRNRSYTVDWFWRDGRTDGGAYRGLERLDGEEAVAVVPAFNERASLWDGRLDNATDRVSDWRLLDGDGDHVDLAVTEAIEIRSGPCRNVTLERVGSNRIRLATGGGQLVDAVSRYVLPAPVGDRADVNLSRIAFRLRDESPRFAVDASLHADRPQGLPPVDGTSDVLAYVQFERERTPRSRVASGTIQFDVSRQRYRARNLDPGGVVIHQYRNGSWAAMETTLAYQTADAYVFEATAPEVAPLAVGVLEPEISVVDVSPHTWEVVQGDEVVVTALIENRGIGDGTVEVAFTVGDTAVDRRTVTLAAGQTRQLWFSSRLNRTGTRALGVDGRTVEVEVQEPRLQLSVVDLATDRSTIEAGEEVVVTATVTNVGRGGGTGTVSFTAFGEETATERVTLEPNESRVVRFAQPIASPGTYTLGVNGERVEVTVTGTDAPGTTPPPSTSGSDGDPTVVLVGLVLLIGLAGLFLWL